MGGCTGAAKPGWLASPTRSPRKAYERRMRLGTARPTSRAQESNFFSTCGMPAKARSTAASTVRPRRHGGVADVGPGVGRCREGASLVLSLEGM
eukprot:8995512-Lingulodinium_polyedra.AAC.1